MIAGNVRKCRAQIIIITLLHYARAPDALDGRAAFGRNEANRVASERPYARHH